VWPPRYVQVEREIFVYMVQSPIYGIAGTEATLIGHRLQIKVGGGKSHARPECKVGSPAALVKVVSSS
jgi:hypothetical protein